MENMETNLANNTSDTTNNTAQNSTITPTRKRTRGSAAKVIALALCCSLVGGAAGAGGVIAYDAFRGNDQVVERTGDRDGKGVGDKNDGGKDTKDDDGPKMRVGKRDSDQGEVETVDTSKELTASEIYSANVNSTVGIQTSVTTNYFGYQTQAAASGSGFILSSDGYIVTNYHVVEDANSIKVTTYDNNTYDAELVGYDESNDIAVLKVDAAGLTPVILGDSDDMQVGDDVVAIGNPLGELTFSLTSGTVSALNRQITINNQAMNLIQTDCAINSGNSGGALFNSHGEVIGITNAKYSSSGSQQAASIDNIGFAIPINTVRNIVTSIIDNGYIEKPYLGITCYTLSNDYRNSSSAAGTTGVVVQDVERGGPAEEAGISSGDVITEIDGSAIKSTSELTSLLSRHKEGDVITLTVYRDGELLTIKVTLGVRQQAALPYDQKQQDQDQSNQRQQDQQAAPGGQSGWGWPGQNGQGSPNQGGQSFPGQNGQDWNGQIPNGNDYPSQDNGYPNPGNNSNGFPGQGNPSRGNEN